MNRHRKIHIAAAAAIVILSALILMRFFVPPAKETAGDSRKEDVSVENTAKPQQVFGKVKTPSPDEDGKIQRLATEIKSFSSDKSMIPQAEGAIRELAAFGNDAIPAMKELLLSDAGRYSKSLAARVLVQIGTSESVGALLDFIAAESDPVSKDLCIRALQAVDSPETAPALIKGLSGSTDFILNTELKQALARTGNEQTVKLLADAYRSQSGNTAGTENILNALSMLRHPDSLPALADAVANDPDQRISLKAMQAISSMGTENSTKTLVEMVQSEKDDAKRVQLINAVSRISGKESLNYLQDISGDPSLPHDLRNAAARAVFTIKNGVPPVE